MVTMIQTFFMFLKLLTQIHLIDVYFDLDLDVSVERRFKIEDDLYHDDTDSNKLYL